MTKCHSCHRRCQNREDWSDTVVAHHTPSPWKRSKPWTTLPFSRPFGAVVFDHLLFKAVPNAIIPSTTIILIIVTTSAQKNKQKSGSLVSCLYFDCNRLSYIVGTSKEIQLTSCFIEVALSSRLGRTIGTSNNTRHSESLAIPPETQEGNISPGQSEQP